MYMVAYAIRSNKNIVHITIPAHFVCDNGNTHIKYINPVSEFHKSSYTHFCLYRRIDEQKGKNIQKKTVYYMTRSEVQCVS